jgi:D-alanyl-D-alanine carboxypeptidase (penicillin-binding protein 5/6)
LLVLGTGGVPAAALPLAALPLAEAGEELSADCNAAVLMEAESGTVLYAKNETAALPLASVTKVMTLLLIMEAMEAGQFAADTPVSVSEYAASMGGSQVFLEAGETLPVKDMIKSIVIASANDAAVAMAELVAGSEEAFVRRMNERAAELGMTSAVFENVTGLDDTVTAHACSALDVAVMSRALIRHEEILEYSSIWMDSIRDGAFTLTNTNRLVRFYPGARGLKTGSTAKAGFCVSAVAEREGMTLICVVMGAPTRDLRNRTATKMLDFGFANYAVLREEAQSIGTLRVLGGASDVCGIEHGGFHTGLRKSDRSRVVRTVELTDAVAAPVAEGAVVGRVTWTLDGEELGSVDLVAADGVERIGFLGLLGRLCRRFALR